MSGTTFRVGISDERGTLVEDHTIEGCLYQLVALVGRQRRMIESQAKQLSELERDPPRPQTPPLGPFPRGSKVRVKHVSNVMGLSPGMALRIGMVGEVALRGSGCCLVVFDHSRAEAWLPTECLAACDPDDE